MSETMLVIPEGTLLYEPDGIHRVTLQFPDEDSAIIYHEWLRELLIKAGTLPKARD